jgi:hypothetical protein
MKMEKKWDSLAAVNEKTKRSRSLVNTGVYLAQASKLGIYGECVNIALVLLDVIMKAMK